MKKGMINVTVFYPSGEGKTFNMDYYVNKHIPFVTELLSPSLKKITVDMGIAGGEPGAPAPNMAIGCLYFDSVEGFQNSFGPHAEKIGADVANYTNSVPVIQISEVQIG